MSESTKTIVKAWQTEDGVYAYAIVRAMEFTGGDGIKRTQGHHRVSRFARKRATAQLMVAWGGVSRDTHEDFLSTYHAFNWQCRPREFPKIIKEVELTPLQIEMACGDWQQPHRNPNGWNGIQVGKRPKIKADEVWCELGRDIVLPKHRDGWEVIGIQLVRWVSPDGHDNPVSKTRITVSTSGYADSYQDGYLNYEFLFHKRIRKFYVDSDKCKGKLCFKVTFRKESTTTEKKGIVHGNV